MAQENTHAPASSPFLSVKEVSSRLGVTGACIYALLKEGRLPYHRLGVGRGAIRISEEDLQKFLEDSRVDGRAEEPKPAASRPKLKHITL